MLIDSEVYAFLRCAKPWDAPQNLPSLKDFPSLGILKFGVTQPIYSSPSAYHVLTIWAGYGLNDSPVGLLAWILELLGSWCSLFSPTPDAPAVLWCFMASCAKEISDVEWQPRGTTRRQWFDHGWNLATRYELERLQTGMGYNWMPANRPACCQLLLSGLQDTVWVWVCIGHRAKTCKHDALQFRLQPTQAEQASQDNAGFPARYKKLFNPTCWGVSRHLSLARLAQRGHDFLELIYLASAYALSILVGDLLTCVYDIIAPYTSCQYL